MFTNIDVIFRTCALAGWQKPCLKTRNVYNMAANSKNMELSDYAKSLNPTAKSRYIEKLRFEKGHSQMPDPFVLKKWENNPYLWPDLTFGDMYSYLIERPGKYTKESLKAYKSLEAYQFFVSGHVKTILFHKIDDLVPFCFLKGRVIPSQRINAKPHDPWVCLNKKDGCVYCAHCDCMAGLGEVCSHVAALLFKIEAGVRLGLTKVSSTSEACKWNKVFRETINPRAVSDFADLVKRNRKKEIGTNEFKKAYPLPDLPVLEKLKLICPKAVFFDSIPKLDPEETDSASENEDEWDLPEPITSLYEQKPQNDHLNPGELKNKYKEIFSKLSYSKEQIENLELKTRNQTISTLWYEHRKGRITASKAHQVLTRKDSTPPDKLLCTIMGYKTVDLSNKEQLKWGIDNEEKAREKYVELKKKKHEDVNCRLSGFLIDRKKIFLGASADGVTTCKCCSQRVLEIKCPYKYRDQTPLEAAKAGDHSFCLDEQGNLKKSHPYYTQVQMQIHVNEVKAGDFCVYTQKGLHVIEGIPYDESFMESLTTKCDLFFNEHLLPEIITRSLSPESNENDDHEQEGEALYCFCNQPESGHMIQCDNDSCEIVWFHYPCVSIRRKPRGKWFCDECKEDGKT